MATLRQTLGIQVRTVREACGLSQEQLGLAAGLGGKYVGMIERGQKAASFEAVERIAGALKVECWELFVPANRKTEAVQQRVRHLLEQKSTPNDSRLEEFLRTLAAALRRLE